MQERKRTTMKYRYIRPDMSVCTVLFLLGRLRGRSGQSPQRNHALVPAMCHFSTAVATRTVDLTLFLQPTRKTSAPIAD